LLLARETPACVVDLREKILYRLVGPEQQATLSIPR
jgi:hypothetical protein